MFVHEPDWYAEHGVDLRLSTRATEVDRSAKQVVLEGGERIGYDKLLLATGSVVRKLNVPGADLAGIEYLRHLTHADRISDALADGKRVVIIGGGWIGLELAAAARLRNATVTLVEALDLPLQRVLGDELG